MAKSARRIATTLGASVVALSLIGGCTRTRGGIPDVVAEVGPNQVTGAAVLREYEVLLELQRTNPSAGAAPVDLDAAPNIAVLQQVAGPLVLDAALKRELAAKKVSVNASDTATAEDNLAAQIEASGPISLPAAYKRLLVKRYAREQAVLRAYQLDDVALQREYESMADELPGQACASHLLVATEAEAKAAIAEIERGAAFAEVASRVSSDTGSAASGGELGCTDPASYVPEFAEALKALQPGQRSGPVKTEFGFHVILRGVDEPVPFEAVRAQLFEAGIGEVQAALQADVQYAEGWNPESPSSAGTFVPLPVKPAPQLSPSPLLGGGLPPPS